MACSESANHAYGDRVRECERRFPQAGADLRKAGEAAAASIGKGSAQLSSSAISATVGVGAGSAASLGSSARGARSGFVGGVAELGHVAGHGLGFIFGDASTAVLAKAHSAVASAATSAGTLRPTPKAARTAVALNASLPKAAGANGSG